MMRKIQLVIFVTALIPAIAMAFPIDIEMNSKGLDIDYRTSQFEMTVALQLTNHDMQAAECAVQFRNGPELARTRRGSLLNLMVKHVGALLESVLGVMFLRMGS